jgi:hypothetical protein
MLCYRKKILIVCQNESNEFQMLWVGFNTVEIIKLCYVVSCCWKNIEFTQIDFCMNLILV